MPYRNTQSIGRPSGQDGSFAAPHVASEHPQSWLIMGETFSIESRYRVIDYLGAGAYGVVCGAQDKEDNCVVAIKKCKKIFQSRTLAKRILREIRLLRLMDHENIVKLRRVLKPIDITDFNELYIVFEIMETDLAQIIRSPQVLRDEHIQYFTFQIALALQYLHGAGIVHRDLKPRNILVNGNCLVKVADFGLARIYNASNNNKVAPMTEYVCTRWYRAPEILVGWNCYSAAVDMWALGTIIGELIGRTPMLPGGDSIAQLDLIVQHLGKPPESFITQCKKPSFRQYLRQHADAEAVPFRELYPEYVKNTGPIFNLLGSLLQYDPAHRLNADETLRHPYIVGLYRKRELKQAAAEAASTSAGLSQLTGPDTSINPTSGPLMSYDTEFNFEVNKLTIEEYQREMLFEVSQYNSYDDVTQLLHAAQHPGVFRSRNYDDSFEARGGRLLMSEVPLKGANQRATILHRVEGGGRARSNTSIRRSRSHSTELGPRAIATAVDAPPNRPRGLSNPADHESRQEDSTSGCIFSTVESCKAESELESQQQIGSSSVVNRRGDTDSAPWDRVRQSPPSSCTIS